MNPQCGISALVTWSCLLSLSLTGCASATLTPVAKGPVSSLELHGNHDPLKTTVENVVVRDGPGSWKSNAYWDEYIVSLANHHRVPLTVHSLRLVDAHGVIHDAGENCWHLEADSRPAGESLMQNVGLGAQAAARTGGRIVAPVGLIATNLALHGLPLTPAGAAAIALPLIGESMTIRSDANHREIVHEFERRRMHLPATLQPGARLQRSGFFQVSPSPRRLIVAYQVGQEFREVTVDLARLNGYHANKGLNLDAVPTPLAPLPPPREPSDVPPAR